METWWGVRNDSFTPPNFAYNEIPSSLYAEELIGGIMGTAGGGAAAIRGFRLQTFYILKRLLAGGSDLFQPESAEDLLRLAQDGTPLEHIQVKSHVGGLTLSVLAKPSSETGKAEAPYFRRVLNRLRSGTAQETLVVVGHFGKQMRGAWAGDEKEQRQAAAYLHKHGYSQAEAELLFKHLHLEEVNPAEQDDQIAAYLQEGMTAGDVRTARYTLAWWLLEVSEQSNDGPPNTVTARDLQTQLQRIGRGIQELRAYHFQWGGALQPLLPDDLRESNISILRRELYEGVGARLEHILANVDVPRAAQLAMLQEAFEEGPFVVLRGASGQGKTALAYRYLYDEDLLPIAFRLGRLQDVTQAQEVLQALQAFLRQHRTELYLLIDVQPGDSLWLDVLREAQGLTNLRVLVTIRQEDWTRTQAELNQIGHKSVVLKFDQEEAEPIFYGLQTVQSSREFLSFADAWNAYRQEGPLLEFVYMVTHQGIHLKARLQQQIEHLSQQWKDKPAYLDFLHAAAYAAAAHARVYVRTLGAHFHLAPRELMMILHTIDEEHLLRTEGGILRGLHAIRSQLLLELLSDPDLSPPEDAFAHVLPATHEDDLEILALTALIQFRTSEVPMAIQGARPTTWQGRVGITRALIWWCVRDYAERVAPAIKQAFDEYEFNWWMFMSIDLLGLRERGLLGERPSWDDGSLFAPEWRKTHQTLQAAFDAVSPDFSPAIHWLATQTTPPTVPQGSGDWLAAAELAFYTGLWNGPINAFETLDLNTIGELPLLEAAEVHYGLHFLAHEDSQLALEKLQLRLVERFKLEGDVKLLEDDESTVCIHFVVPSDDTLNPRPGKNPIHEAAMIRLDILHFIYPQRTTFTSQGYGHQNNMLQVRHQFDDTHFHIAKKWFPPTWGTQWNAAFHRIADLPLLLKDWQAHAEYQLKQREEILRDIQSLAHLLPHSVNHLKRWYSGREGRSAAFVQALRAHALRRAAHLLLPRSAVDPWGLAITSRSGSRRQAHETPTVEALSRQLQADHHDPYFKALREYSSDLNTFFRQASEGIYALSTLHTSRNEEVRFRREHATLINSVRLSTVNLREGMEHLPAMQTTFRERFGHLIDSERLTALEQNEARALHTLWEIWPELARVPAIQRRGAPELTAEQLIARYRGRLEQEVRRLQDRGIKVRLLDSEERVDPKAPNLWLTLEVGSLEDLYVEHEELFQGLVRVLKPLESASWGLDILWHEWSAVAVIPTRYGRPIPRLAWVHSLVMLHNPEYYFWRHQPTEVPPNQLISLGLRPWQITLEPWIVQTMEQTLLCFEDARRAESLHALFQLPNLPENIRNELEAELVSTREYRAKAVKDALQRGLDLQSNTNDRVFVETTLDPHASDWLQNRPETALEIFGKQLEEHQAYFANLHVFLKGLDHFVLNQIDQQITQTQQFLRPLKDT